MPASIPALPVAAASRPSPSEPPATASSATVAASLAWATMLSALSGDPASGDPASQLKQCRERVAIGSGLPTVPKRLVERIQKWEYVDLAELLPSQSLHDQVVDSRAKFTLFPGYEIVRPKKRQVESITDWVKAFTVFTAVVATTEQTRVPELLAYQLTIIKAAQSYDGLQWRAYDAHFRVAAAATGNKSWSKLDVDLYTRFFTWACKGPAMLCNMRYLTEFRRAVLLAAARRKEGYKPSPALPSKRRRSWGPNVCQLYNSSSCPFGLKCKFKHSCGDCGGAHSAKVCTFTPKQTGGQ